MRCRACTASCYQNGPGIRNGPQACMDFLKEFVDDNEASARYADDLSLLGKAARKVSE